MKPRADQPPGHEPIIETDAYVVKLLKLPLSLVFIRVITICNEQRRQGHRRRRRQVESRRMDVCRQAAGVLFALIRLSQQRNPMFNVREREREFSFARQGEQQH